MFLFLGRFNHLHILMHGKLTTYLNKGHPLMLMCFYICCCTLDFAIVLLAFLQHFAVVFFFFLLLCCFVSKKSFLRNSDMLTCLFKCKQNAPAPTFNSWLKITLLISKQTISRTFYLFVMFLLILVLSY